MIKRISQIAFEPENFEESIKSYLDLGFEKVGEFEKENGKAKAVLLRLNGFDFEIWKFNDKSSKLYPIRNHTGLEVEDIEAELEKMVKNGCKVRIPITKGITVRNYAFVENSDGQILELIEK